jgi:hypothetical protein
MKNQVKYKSNRRKRSSYSSSSRENVVATVVSNAVAAVMYGKDAWQN